MIPKNYKIQDTEIFKTFCNERNVKEGTIKKHLTSLKNYTNFNNMTLEELVKEADEEEEKNIRKNKRKIRKRNNNQNQGSQREANANNVQNNQNSNPNAQRNRNNRRNNRYNDRKGYKNRNEVKAEETIDDIRKDNDRIEKEIWLEIAGIHTVKLD